MASIAPDATIASSDNQIATIVEDTVVVLNHDTGEYLGLHGIGPRVWELLDQEPTVNELLDTISEEYSVSRTRCRTDLLTFVGELVENDLATIEDGTPR